MLGLKLIHVVKGTTGEASNIPAAKSKLKQVEHMKSRKKYYDRCLASALNQRQI